METFFACDFDEIPVASCQTCNYNKVMVPAYLLAQIRAASRASEDNCSYSLETMWTQRGNSSTLARLRPRSKIRILGSGTPRLKRDFGYGYRKEKVSSYLEAFCCLSSPDIGALVEIRRRMRICGLSNVPNIPCSCSSDNILLGVVPSRYIINGCCTSCERCVREKGSCRQITSISVIVRLA